MQLLHLLRLCKTSKRRFKIVLAKETSSVTLFLTAKQGPVSAFSGASLLRVWPGLSHLRERAAQKKKSLPEPASVTEGSSDPGKVTLYRV